MNRTRTMIAALALLALVAACGEKRQPTQPPPPQVSVIKLVPSFVTFTEEYVGQTEAVDALEIRARVGGLLDRRGSTPEPPKFPRRHLIA